MHLLIIHQEYNMVKKNLINRLNLHINIIKCQLTHHNNISSNNISNIDSKVNINSKVNSGSNNNSGSSSNHNNNNNIHELHNLLSINNLRIITIIIHDMVVDPINIINLII